MMSWLTSVQIFIHKQYDNIKLILQFVIIGLLLVAIINANTLTERISSENRETTEEILARIDEETQRQSQEIQRQTNQLNQQFQALCFIMVELAGEQALREIDPPLEEQCRDLVGELREEAQREADNTPPPTQPAQPQSTEAPVPNTAPDPRPDSRAPNTVQPDPPEPPRNDSWLLGGVNSLLNSIGL